MMDDASFKSQLIEAGFIMTNDVFRKDTALNLFGESFFIRAECTVSAGAYIRVDVNDRCVYTNEIRSCYVERDDIISDKYTHKFIQLYEQYLPVISKLEDSGIDYVFNDEVVEFSLGDKSLGKVILIDGKFNSVTTTYSMDLSADETIEAFKNSAVSAHKIRKNLNIHEALVD